MNLLDKRSIPSAHSELQLFNVPATQVAITKSTTTRINPKNSIDTFPLIFELPQQKAFVDFSRSQLYCKFKITLPDGTDISSNPPADGGNPADVVAPITYIGSTFFQQLKFYANNRLVYDSRDTLCYKSYIEAALGESKEEKESNLQAARWEEDTPGKEVGGNAGVVARNEYGKNSTEFETISPIHCELFTPNRLLPNMADYRLELFRNPDNFLLLSDKGKDYKIKLIQAYYLVRVVEVTPSCALAFESQLLKTPAKVPIRKVTRLF
jgi:hypothetical protein